MKLTDNQQAVLDMIKAGEERKAAVEKLGVRSYRALQIRLANGKDKAEQR